MAISFAIAKSSCGALRKLMDTPGNIRPRVSGLRYFTEISIGTMRWSSLSTCQFRTSHILIPSAAGAARWRRTSSAICSKFLSRLLQDYTLFHLLNEYSLDLWKAQTELITKKNGLVSFIVHPDYVIEKRAQDIYRGLLSFLRQQGAGRESGSLSRGN